MLGAKRRAHGGGGSPRVRHPSPGGVHEKNWREESLMKFTWFHLMPYRFLPDDFKQKYRSVWVDIPRSLYDPKIGHQLYNEYLDSLEFADQAAFDGLGSTNHPQTASSMIPSPTILHPPLSP